MSRPTRQTAGGRAYLDLQNRARREGRTTQELLILYVLERWLARLAASPAAGTFVLKGGMLLAALAATAGYRQVSLVPLSSVIGALPTTRQAAYQAFRKRLGADGAHLPAAFGEVVSAVVAFVDPLVVSQRAGVTWLPTARQWR